MTITFKPYSMNGNTINPLQKFVVDGKQYTLARYYFDKALLMEDHKVISVLDSKDIEKAFPYGDAKHYMDFYRRYELAKSQIDSPKPSAGLGTL